MPFVVRLEIALPLEVPPRHCRSKGHKGESTKTTTEKISGIKKKTKEIENKEEK
jgi:hypothetical protein